MRRSRIPQKQLLFITYLVLVNDYLQTIQPGATEARGIVLGMSIAELAALKAFVKSFISGDPDEPGIWDIHKNKDTKTQKSTAMMKSTKKEFGVFFRPLLNRMNASPNITVADRIILEISDPNPAHTRPKKRIQENCYANALAIGHGFVKMECRSSSDSKRASRPARATGVEVAWCKAKSDASGNFVIPDPETVATRFISTKASFELILPNEYVCTVVYLWVRWINSKYPDLPGLWSAAITISIS
ncbi:MAG: hypothetical protein WCL06_13545 [Bacteroidota bacterium]